MHVFIPALHRPTKPTGVCRHAANLAQGLATNDAVDNITLAIGEWQVPYFSKLLSTPSDKIKIIVISIRNTSVFRNIWFLFQLPKLAHQLQPTITHIPFPLPFIRSRFPCPIVLTLHDLYPFEMPENFGFPQVLFNQLFLRLSIANSNSIASVSKTTLRALDSYFPRVSKRIECPVIYNCVDFSQIPIQISERLNQFMNHPFLLTVAQHRKNKNLDLLVSACQLLQQQPKFNSLQLLVVGSSGPETENLCRQIESLQLQDSVHFLSSIEDSELAWLYDQCQIFVIPSSTEGFCLPLVEALNFGCKIVCSDIPILREVGSNQCHYVNLEEFPVERLCSAITAVLQHERSESKIHDIRFKMETITNQYLNLYQSLCDS